MRLEMSMHLKNWNMYIPNLIIGINEMYLQLHQPLFIGCVASQVAVIDRFCLSVNILQQCANLW